jgi:hypothetical protein
MEELVQLVSQKTGLSAEHARTAVTTVVGFLKSKLPAPIAAQLDGVISGGSGGLGNMMGSLGGQAGDIAKGIGDMFGKKS